MTLKSTSQARLPPAEAGHYICLMNKVYERKYFLIFLHIPGLFLFFIFCIHSNTTFFPSSEITH